MKTNLYIINIFALLILLSATQKSMAQEIEAAETETEETVSNDPVRWDWTSGYLIDNYTPYMPYANTFQFVIHHRFGTFGNGLSDLYGIYAPSNIRLGINYGATDNIMVGVGYEKNNKLIDLNLKWRLLQQTITNSMPVTVALFGDLGIDARSEEVFGVDYTFTNRFSYFGEMIIARKFNDNFSAQIAPNFTHFNAVDTLWEHDKVGIHAGARYKIYNEISAMVTYDFPIDIEGIREYSELHNESKPSLGVGLEIGTTTHVFQIFAANFDNIVPQKNYLYNSNDISDNGTLIGFNIIVRF